PAYFIDGKPQQRGKFMNNTTGTSSTAAKLSSAFVLGSKLFDEIDQSYSRLLEEKSLTAYAYALKKPGVIQTVSVKTPYIYAEGTWVDDMGLAATKLGQFDEPWKYIQREPVTPWVIDDTPNPSHWYAFIDPGIHDLVRRAE